MLDVQTSERSDPTFNMGVSEVADSSTRPMVRLASKRQVSGNDTMTNPEITPRSLQKVRSSSIVNPFGLGSDKSVRQLNAESVLEEAPASPGNIRIVPGAKLQRQASRQFQFDEIDKRKNIPTSGRRDSINFGIVEEVRSPSGKFLDNEEQKDSRDEKNYIFDLAKFPLSNPEFETDLVIGQFSDVTHLTDGSNSNIYKANIASSDQPVILKVIKDSTVINTLAVTEFARESLIISKLNHPHILTIYGTGQVQSKMNAAFQRPLLALEALDGGSLTHHLKIPRPHNSFPFTVPRYMRIAKELADALNYLHEKFDSNCIIIHRDLKPDNIGFTANGTLKLMDFGLCITIKRNCTADGLYELTGETGSRRYMPPEVGLRRKYNEKVDIYAYGIILYEIMTGTTPYSGFKMDKFDDLVFVQHKRPPMDYDIYGRVPKLVPIVKVFIERCWDKDSSLRPSAREAYELFVAQEAEAKSKGPGLLGIFTRKDTI